MNKGTLENQTFAYLLPRAFPEDAEYFAGKRWSLVELSPSIDGEEQDMIVLKNVFGDVFTCRYSTLISGVRGDDEGEKA